ncbi:ATP/GTP-binding protein [Kocuria palustris]|nr:ATP/GTP-binding protein [Kocuria palustris]
MFGQVVVGGPGAGKSTYCYGMYQFLLAIGRSLAVINLDPANDLVPYPVAVDIRDYITLEEIMDELNLGPNGGLMYAMENLSQQGIDEFISRIEKLAKDGTYLLFDCPGQVELFTHHNSLHDIFKRLQSQAKLRLVSVMLVDCFWLTLALNYVLVLLLTLRAMLQLDMPHILVFSKIDMLKGYGQLPFRLDFYTDCENLAVLEPHLIKESNSVLGKRYVDLTRAIAEVVEDFGLVLFEVLSVENKRSMVHLLSIIDKANGYSFGSEVGGDTVWAEASRQGGLADIDIHERWIDYKSEWDKKEAEEERAQMEGNTVDEDDLL